MSSFLKRYEKNKLKLLLHLYYVMFYGSILWIQNKSNLTPYDFYPNYVFNHQWHKSVTIKYLGFLLKFTFQVSSIPHSLLLRENILWIRW